MPAPSPPPFNAADLNPKVVRSLIRSFPPLTSPGPSGLRASHLQDLLSSTSWSQVCTSLTQWITLSSSCSLPLPHLTLFSAATLIPIPKKTGGVRPIAVGETLRRLTSKALQHLLSPSITATLLPLQKGINLPEACTHTVHVINHLMHASSPASSPPQYALTVDLSNAFNTISRESVHASLARFIPSLIPWFLATHSTPATLYIPDSPPILSREGVQQGDPLGPVFFALGIHGAIVDWTARHPSVWSSWYLDDGILWGTATDLNNALTDLQEAFACLGLRLNTNKSFLFSKHDTPIPRNLAGLAPLQLVPFSSGLTILGSPVGAPHSILHFLHSKLLSMRDMLSSLTSLQHPQAALILLRASLGVCRITHLLRSIPPSSLGPFISDLSALLHTTLEAVLSFPLDERAWAQASLPLSLGGLGVTDPRAIAHAAYLPSSFSFIPRAPQIRPYTPQPRPRRGHGSSARPSSAPGRGRSASTPPAPRVDRPRARLHPRI